MQANEIRIGNLVQDEEGIFPITATYFNLLELNLETTEPIPLTEEWLLRLGYFITETNEGVEAFMQNHRYSVKELIGKDDWLYCDGEQVLTNIKYVHQLQNLYFALTTEELTLKN